MRVEDIYFKYRTPLNLQQHMLRVAAFAALVLEEWIGTPLDTESIVTTLLFHDIAKPVTFDLAKQGQFITSQPELQKLKEDVAFLIKNFGTDEHQAALKIFQELGLSTKAQHLIENLEWRNVPRLIKENDFEALVTIYCDMRVGPQGILDITERILELHARAPIENLEARLVSGKHLESIMVTQFGINLDHITNEQIVGKAKELSQKPIGLKAT